MAKKKAQKVFVSKLVVEGRGPFPLDMLRYDGCMAWDEQNTSMMTSTLFEYPSPARRVTLRRACPNDRDAEVGRWNSFGWNIIEETPLATWSL